MIWLLLAALGCGLLIACAAWLMGRCTQSFAISLLVLPAIVQLVLTMVNGNLGTGVAVMGAFSLVRFRSAPGGAREICLIFLAMAAGLCCATGYVVYGLLAVCVICGVMLLVTRLPLTGIESAQRSLKITVPEDLNAFDAFDSVLAAYTRRYRLEGVKTSNMGSLFTLTYEVTLKDTRKEKELIDALRCRNGNLAILSTRQAIRQEEL